MSQVYFGTVVDLDGGVFVEVPSLAPGFKFGPCMSSVGADTLAVGTSVAVVTTASTDEVLVLGPVAGAATRSATVTELLADVASLEGRVDAAGGAVAPVLVRGHVQTAYDVPNATFVKINPDTFSADTDAMWDGGAKQFVAKKAGYYRAYCQVAYGGTPSAGHNGAYIVRNGAQVTQSVEKFTGTGQNCAQVEDLIYLDVGDTLYFMTYQTSGNPQPLQAGARWWTFCSLTLEQPVRFTDPAVTNVLAMQRRSDRMITGGGRKSCYQSSLIGGAVTVTWNQRFIAISHAKGPAPLLSSGYYNAQPPPNGTVIPGINRPDYTVGTSGEQPGIQLRAWDSLFFVPTPNSTEGTYRVTNYNGPDFAVPPEWVWIATYNSDEGVVHWATGEKTGAGPSGVPMTQQLAAHDDGVSRAWLDYTPTPVNFTPGSGATFVGRYVRRGRRVRGYAICTLGSGFSVATGMGLSLPFQAYNADQAMVVGRMTDVGSNDYVGAAVAGPNHALMYGIGNFGAFAGISNTAPFTWAQGDLFRFVYDYETLT